jgi:hypothetical protein
MEPQASRVQQKHSIDLAGPAWLETLRRETPLLIVLLFLGSFYVSIFHSYRAYEIDNPWYLSFSRNLFLHHYRSDFFLNGIFPDGMGGTLVFGRLPATLQAAILNHVGWMPVPAMLVSTVLVLAGLSFWFSFLRRQGFSPAAGGAMILALGLTEPFVGMAERFRFEPFCFLLLGVAFWLAAGRRAWLALVVGLLALEAEPAASLVFLALVIFMARSGKWRLTHLVYGIAIAGGCFGAIYFALHPDILQVLRDTNWHRGSGQREVGGFLRAYFISRKRHLPELLLLILAVLVYLRKGHQASPFIHRMAECAAVGCVFSFVMSWPTPAYMVFFYPFALVVAGWALQTRWQNPWLLPIVVGAIMLPQYGVLAVVNRHEGFRPQDIAQVADAIRQSEQTVGLDDANVQIMGDYSLWFAHPDNYRALATTTRPHIHAAQMFTCFDAPLRPASMVDPVITYCSELREIAGLREVKQLKVRGHQLHILVAPPAP